MNHLIRRPAQPAASHASVSHPRPLHEGRPHFNGIGGGGGVNHDDAGDPPACPVLRRQHALAQHTATQFKPQARTRAF